MIQISERKLLLVFIFLINQYAISQSSGLAEEIIYQLQSDEIAKIDGYSIGITTKEQFFKDGWNIDSGRIGIIALKSDRDTTYILLGFITNQFDSTENQQFLNLAIMMIQDELESIVTMEIVSPEYRIEVCQIFFMGGILKYRNWVNKTELMEKYTPEVFAFQKCYPNPIISDAGLKINFCFLEKLSLIFIENKITQLY